MSVWVDFIVYAALIVAIWGWLPAWSEHFTIPVLADRNPDWVATHPDAVKKLVEGRWFRWSCWLWGLVSLVGLSVFQLDLWPRSVPPPVTTPKWEALKDINSLFLIVGLVYGVVCSILFFQWLHRTVPLAVRREATLERRSMSDYLPRWCSIVIYAVVTIHVAAWLIVGALQLYSTSKFWGRLVVALVLPTLLFVMTKVAVNRRPSAIDRIFGPAYRRAEVRIGFAMQLIPPIGGAVRLYEEIAGTHLIDLNRFLHVGVALVVVSWALRFAVLPRRPADPIRSESRRSPGLVSG